MIPFDRMDFEDEEALFHWLNTTDCGSINYSMQDYPGSKEFPTVTVGDGVKIAVYALIFVCAILGNCLVIAVVSVNR